LHILVILALRKWRKEDGKLKNSLVTYQDPISKQTNKIPKPKMSRETDLWRDFILFWFLFFQHLHLLPACKPPINLILNEVSPFLVFLRVWLGVSESFVASFLASDCTYRPEAKHDIASELHILLDKKEFKNSFS
jgi:hypothetical protein